MDSINALINKIEFIFEDYENRTEQLKNICNDIRNKNPEDKYIFSLDSFFYQINLYNIDYQYYRKIHSTNLNRFYCNYMYLSKIICNFIKTSITNKKLFNIIDFFKPYEQHNSLDIFKEYDFIITKKLYKQLEKSIDLITKHLEHKKNQLEKYNEFNENGLNLFSFINQYKYTVDNIETNLQLIIKYKNDIDNKHLFYLNYLMDKINISYLKLKNIDIKNILSKNIKCQDKIAHEHKLTKVHNELIKTEPSKTP